MSISQIILKSWTFKIGFAGFIMGIPIYLLNVLNKPQIYSVMNILIIMILSLVIIILGLIVYLNKVEIID